MTEPFEPYDFGHRPTIDRGLIWRIIVIQTAMYAAFSLVLVNFIPRFGKIFRDFDAELPAPTRMLIDLSNFYLSNWFLFLPLWLGTTAGLVVLCLTQCPDIARRLSTGMVVCYCVFFLIVVYAMFMPLIALMDKLS